MPCEPAASDHYELTLRLEKGDTIEKMLADIDVPEADRKAFNNFLKITGAGDNPMFLRFIHNVARTFDEPKPPAVNPKPPPNNGRPPKRGLRSLYRDPAT